MALTAIQQNIATEIQDIALKILALKSRAEVASKMFQTESMNGLTDADYDEYPELEHVDAQEMTAAKNALDAIVTTIGAYDAGTNATKLAKVLTTVPK